MNEYNETIEAALYQICLEFLMYKLPFTLLIDNHNNWSSPLPDRLRDKEQFLLNIKEQALEDSYIEDGKIVIVTMIGDTEYTKKLDCCDIGAVSISEKTPPIIMKNFRTLPEVEIKPGKQRIEPTEEGIIRSTLVFKKHNPQFFKED